MIGFLEGKVQHTHHNPIIVVVSGVGYQVHVPPSLLPEIQDGTASFHIHTHVTDNAIDLYGFSTRSALELFTLLLTVSGIGPKTALLVMDKGTDEIKAAVADSDLPFFTTIPRLGKKNAQKIIIELKSKITGSLEFEIPEGTESETTTLIEALGSMGFMQGEIRKAIQNIPKNSTTMEDKMKQALKILSK